MDFEYTAQKDSPRAPRLVERTHSGLTQQRSFIWIGPRFAIQLAWQKQLHSAPVGSASIGQNLWRSRRDGHGQQSIARRWCVRAYRRSPASWRPYSRTHINSLGYRRTEETLHSTILTGEEIWCQGYSEPGAVSDIAALQTRAVEEGDDRDQRTEGVDLLRAVCPLLLAARADRSHCAQTQRDFVGFVVDMQTPGIIIRPLQQINGDAEFNEVFSTTCEFPRRTSLAT